MNHILHLPAWYPTDKNPTNGLFIQSLVNGICDANPSIYHTIVTFNHNLLSFNGKNLFKFLYKYLIPDQSVKSQNYTNLVNIELRRIIELSPRIGGNYIEQISFRIIRLIRRMAIKPDLVHVHVSYPGIRWAHYIYLELGIPYIVTEHSSRFPDIRFLQYRYMPEEIENWYTQAYQIIFVSKYLASKYSGMNASVISNLVELPAKIDTERPSDIFQFLMICQMNEENKRLDLVLRAAATLKQSGEKFKLCMIGDGSLRKKYIEYATTLDLEEMVSWPGTVMNEEKWTIYHQSDCLIVASDVETFSIVIVEAHFCGVPVIASKCGGPEDLITTTNGILFDKGDLNQLVQAMTKVMHSKGLFSKTKIRESALGKFHPELIKKQYMELYQKMFSDSHA